MMHLFTLVRLSVLTLDQESHVLHIPLKMAASTHFERFPSCLRG